MKKLILAAAIAFAPTAAQAAITIAFTGTTFAPSDVGATGGSYVQTYDASLPADSRYTYAIDQLPQNVFGTIVIDTAALGPNQSTAPDVSYTGDVARPSFATVTFASTGATPLKLVGQQTAQALGTQQGFTFDLFNADDTYSYSLSLFSPDAIPTALFDGTLVPDFTQATSLFFAVQSNVGTPDLNTQTLSLGTVSAIAQQATAVPEPATWMLMILGFGLVGATIRRPRHAAPAHA